MLCLGPAVGRAGAEEACPKAQRLSIDLDAWVAAARRLKTPAEFDKALATLGLKPAAEDENGFPCEPRELRKLRVDLFSPTLRDGESGRVVQVLAALCPDSSEAWQVQRGAAFLPIGKDTWCRVDMPFLDQSGSGWGPQLCNPTVFAFQNLTSAQHVAVKVTDTEEWCGTSGSDRGSKTELSWWEMQGWKFVPLLSITTNQAYYHSPTPPIETLTTKVRLTGVYPKVVELDEKVTCDDPGPEERREDPELRQAFKACKKRVVHSRCEYENGKYTCLRKK